MNATAAVELQKRHDAGIYEIIGYGSKHRWTPEEKAARQREFTMLSMTPTTPVEQRKTTLPATEYPELYEMKKRVAWLKRRAQEQHRK